MALSSISAYQGVLQGYHPANFVPDTPLPQTALPKVDVCTCEETNDVASQAGLESEAVNAAPGFGDMVKGFMTDVNDRLKGADEKTRELMSGKIHDTGAVVTSIEEADLAFQFALAIRAKIMTAYQAVNTIQF